MIPTCDWCDVTIPQAGEGDQGPVEGGGEVCVHGVLLLSLCPEGEGPKEDDHDHQHLEQEEDMVPGAPYLREESLERRGVSDQLEYPGRPQHSQQGQERRKDPCSHPEFELHNHID